MYVSRNCNGNRKYHGSCIYHSQKAEKSAFWMWVSSFLVMGKVYAEILSAKYSDDDQKDPIHLKRNRKPKTCGSFLKEWLHFRKIQDRYSPRQHGKWTEDQGYLIMWYAVIYYLIKHMKHFLIFFWSLNTGMKYMVFYEKMLYLKL